MEKQLSEEEIERLFSQQGFKATNLEDVKRIVKVFSTLLKLNNAQDYKNISMCRKSLDILVDDDNSITLLTKLNILESKEISGLVKYTFNHEGIYSLAADTFGNEQNYFLNEF